MSQSVKKMKRWCMRTKDVKVGMFKTKHSDSVHCSLKASKDPNGPLHGNMKG